VEYKEALKLLDAIEENVEVCCAITMDPDDVLSLIDKLRLIIKNGEKHENETNGRPSST
tara:strand:- start:350 stop:526 length:177 start_codon:yes stop_codon:yes gene_type:complete